MMITFYKTDKKGRIRYYSIDNRQGNLFSPHTFTVNSGTALTAGREKAYIFATRREMDAKLRALIDGRIKNGYRVLYTYFRKNEYQDLRPVLKRAQVS
jgi:hypothetical protein